MAGLTVTRPWFHPHPHKCCGGLGSRQNWIPTKVRGCERLEAPRTPLKCSMQWNRWQCSPEDRSGRHCYRKNTGLPVCLGRVCTALGVFWWDCWRLASWLSAEAEKGDSLKLNPCANHSWKVKGQGVFLVFLLVSGIVYAIHAIGA